MLLCWISEIVTLAELLSFSTICSNNLKAYSAVNKKMHCDSHQMNYMRNTERELQSR